MRMSKALIESHYICIFIGRSAPIHEVFMEIKRLISKSKLYQKFGKISHKLSIFGCGNHKKLLEGLDNMQLYISFAGFCCEASMSLFSVCSCKLIIEVGVLKPKVTSLSADAGDLFLKSLGML